MRDEHVELLLSIQVAAQEYYDAVWAGSKGDGARLKQARVILGALLRSWKALEASGFR